MLFGRVKGTAVCTLKYPGTEGLKLLIVQPLNKKLEPVGLLQVAADPHGRTVMVELAGTAAKEAARGVSAIRNSA